MHPSDTPKFLLSVFFIMITPFSVLLGQCGVNATSGTITIPTANTIVNSYYAGTGSPVIGNSSLIVGTIDARGNSTPIAAGDLVMIIQMQGADINSTNTNSYGNGVAGAPGSGYLATNLYAGYYEYNTVSTVVSTTINFSYSLARNYYTQAFSAGNAIRSYQVIRVPRYFNLSISASSSITAPSWNGKSGGVVVLDAANIITFSATTATVTVAGLGFRGGGGKQFTGATAGNSNGATAITITDYRYNSPVTTAGNTVGGAKGEGIAGTPLYIPNPAGTTTTTGTLEGYINGSMGWGAPANAGGGGTDGSAPLNQYNTGGGGGANAGAGGKGGSGWDGTGGNAAVYPTGGEGGNIFTQAGLGRIIMGGGGGAGTANNSTVAQEYYCSGGAGGGIIFIRAKSYAGNGAVIADGAAAIDITGAGQTDAAGGGGAGGSIILVTNQAGATGLGSITASAKGGNGASMTTYYSHGPGGGGGGGIIYTNGSLASTSVAGGTNGKTHTCCVTGNPLTDNYGAVAGSNGSLITLSFFPVILNPNNALSPCGVLPVRLKEFTAVATNETAVLLSWQVEQQVNFKEFIIEYSSDGQHFSSLGIVGFDANKLSYNFTHQAAGSGVNYYRLKMTDNDGSYLYSKVLSVRFRITGNHVLSAYPNPSFTNMTIRVQAAGSQPCKMVLADNAGRIVIQKQFSLVRGQNYISFPEFDQLPAGTYNLRAGIDDNAYTEKLVKLKQ